MKPKMEHALSDVAELSRSDMAAFAAAAATRQLSAYERMARSESDQHPGKSREVACRLWAGIGAPVDAAVWSSYLDDVMSLLPEESDGRQLRHAFADHALSSLAYAIRCLLTKPAQESAFAARRVYEAADQAAIRLLGIRPGTADNEAAIRSHEVVQRELKRRETLRRLRRRHA